MSPLFFILIAVSVQRANALVEFNYSRLYDEIDLAVQSISIDYCDVKCRVYVSIAADSDDVTSKIFVRLLGKSGSDSMSLTSLSKDKNGLQKGYWSVQSTADVDLLIVNENKNFATAPVAVWIVREDAPNSDATVMNAGDLTATSEYFSMDKAVGPVTIMSVEPFTIHSSQKSPQTTVIATLTGFDAASTDSEDECRKVVDTIAGDPFDIQAHVRSPLITLVFKGGDRAITADFDTVGNTLDFSGISFVTSPGYIGCKGQEKFRSSLYEETTFAKFFKCYRRYDVLNSAVLNTDEYNPVVFKDVTNNDEHEWWGVPRSDGYNNEDYIVTGTRHLEISWKSNGTQSFLVRMAPYFEQEHEDGLSHQDPCYVSTTTEERVTSTPQPPTTTPTRTTRSSTAKATTHISTNSSTAVPTTSDDIVTTTFTTIPPTTTKARKDTTTSSAFDATTFTVFIILSALAL